MRYDKAEFKAAYGTFGQLPESDLPEIAFAGRSNVGKSSLLNKLFQRKNLARLGVRALICGTLTCYMSAAIAGILVK